VIVWLLWLYDAINNLSPLRVAAALDHTRSLLHLEAAAHVNIERSLNAFTSGHHLLAVVVSNYYDNVHFVVTFAVLGWLWVARPDGYRRWRAVLVVINLIGFATFWVYPMAPPRMLAGFVDTVAASGAFGSWHSGGLAAQANQYAAMPSLHVAWAVWSGLAIWHTTRRRLVRGVAVLYPLLTVFAVLATANHLLIDSAAGVAAVAVAVAVEANLARTWAHVRVRFPARILAAPADDSHDQGVPSVPRAGPGSAEVTEPVRLDGSSRSGPRSGVGSGRTPPHGPRLPQC
jgi:hypothetical protein